MDGVNNDIAKDVVKSAELLKMVESQKKRTASSSDSSVKKADSRISLPEFTPVKRNDSNKVEFKEVPLIKPSHRNSVSKVKADTPKPVKNNEEEVKKEVEQKEKETPEIKEETKVLSDGTLLYFRVEESKNEETGAISKELVVYLVDEESGDILRRVPPEEFNDPYNKKYRDIAGSGGFINQMG